MGGDHKCPVCQATFTRPQHVARHMRSHTGDRPYKCQHCGDQFARSDLLSRHVNKCHATEKPSATNTRRKGSAAASRATTSKQACDQCVQASLSCDCSNPCSKCVQRKCRCTFVKFHRQTAPSGPGHHNPRPTSSSSSLSTSSRVSSLSHLDDFILAHPPLSVPSMAPPEQLYVNTFAFNPAYPTSSDTSHLSLTMTTDSDNMLAKYTQAELVRRNGNILSNPQTTAAIVPGLYTNSPHSPTSANWYGWNDGPPATSSTSQPGLMADGVSLDYRYMPVDEKDTFSRNFPSDRDGHRFPPGSAAPPQQFQNNLFSANLSGSSLYRPRSSSLDFSDGGSSATSQSVPSSATSSSVHLPLGGVDIFHGAPNDYQQQQSGLLLDQNLHKFTQHQPSTSQPQQQTREGGFSSAFGSMSIEDHNVLAGISNDGVPFFSQGSPNATPMPIKPVTQSDHNARNRPMSTAGTRDTETRELRDFWKAYMHPPFSGGPTALDATMINQAGPLSPSGQRRRARVSSLPSVKTPIVEHTHARMENGHIGAGEAVVGGRTTLHGNTEDLRSYEAAVNARNEGPGMQLNLVPKRKGTRPSSTTSSPIPPIAPQLGGNDNNAPAYDFSDPSRPNPSSSSTASQLAFGSSSLRPQLEANSVNIQLPMMTMPMHISTSLPPPRVVYAHTGSRESSVASDDGAGSSDGEHFRPSFKRLPSQTLGPANSKRALLATGVGDNHGDTLSVLATNGDLNMNGVNVNSQVVVPLSARPMVGLRERHRRTSEVNVQV